MEQPTQELRELWEYANSVINIDQMCAKMMDHFETQLKMLPLNETKEQVMAVLFQKLLNRLTTGFHHGCISASLSVEDIQPLLDRLERKGVVNASTH